MRHMRRKSVSPQTTELEWLQASYDKKKKRSLELGVKAIDTLIKEGKTVSYRTVSDKSKTDGRPPADAFQVIVQQRTLSEAHPVLV
ncbi:hypothetical protein D3C79_1040790 [compost metagenome]